MPYDNVPEERWGDMESCVQKVMSEHSGEEGFAKENAIAICYNSIMGGDVEASEHGLTLSPVTSDDLERWGHPAFADEATGELVKAEGVALCHAERNANGDGITTQNIRELAATLNLTPLDVDHKPQEVVGVFVNPRQSDWASPAGLISGGALMSDLVLYANRFPNIVADIKAGKRRPSIEARSKQVSCSICGGDKWFSTQAEYCDHLMPMLMGSRVDDGVTRWHKDMRAVGGGAVLHPAGTAATFGDNFVVVAHEVEKEPDAELDAPAFIRAAWDHVSRMENAGALEARIIAAWKRLGLDEPLVGQEQGGAGEAICTILLASLEDAMTEATVEQLQAELDAANTRVAELEAEVQDHATRAANAVASAREQMLANAGMTQERIGQLKPQLADMDDEVFATLVSLQGEVVEASEAAEAAEDSSDEDEASVAAGQIAVGDEDTPAPPEAPFSVFEMED